MLSESFIHLAGVDVLAFGVGPWDHDLMAPSGPPCPHWRSSISRIKGIPIPYGAPNAAAHIERFMGSLKRECLNHFIFLSENHLHRTVVAYIAYYNEGRPHQGIEGIPECGPVAPGHAHNSGFRHRQSPTCSLPATLDPAGVKRRDMGPAVGVQLPEESERM